MFHLHFDRYKKILEQIQTYLEIEKFIVRSDNIGILVYAFISENF